MSDTRHKNVDWRIPNNSDGTVAHRDAELAVLMDIRDELQTLNGTLRCPNFLAIPAKLDAIRRNTAKPRPRKGSRRR